MENYNKPSPINFQGDLKKEWKRFKTHFDCFLNAADLNHVSEARKTSIFLNLAGEEAFDLFESFKLSDQDRHSYVVVVNEFEKHFLPKPIISLRYRFHTRLQNHGESFDHYQNALKKVAEKCDFGDLKDSLIRDQIVYGLNNNDVRKKLLEYDDLSLDELVEFCRKEYPVEAETVANGNRSINGTRRCVYPNQAYMCKKCGSMHKVGECIAYGHRCEHCNGMNHFTIGCLKKNFGIKP